VSPDEIAEALRGRFPEVFVARGEVTVIVAREDLPASLAWLRDEPGLAFDFLSCVSATDWPDAQPRFWVDYELRAMAHHHRLRVKAGAPADDPRVPSVTAMFPTANWQEREVYDFYGIVFEGHPDLTRIMLPDDWEGHPLRKDEELGGVPTWYKGATVPPVDRRGMA
jgi:NADH-quinone oxidoreductase subunit C